MSAVIANGPWSDPGWLAEMTAWIDGRLADIGIRRRGPLTEVRSWSRASLHTFDTDRGRMWAKAVPEVFAHEVAVTLLLADIDPGVVPPVVAADPIRGRIITEHVAGANLATLDKPAVWAATLSRLAEIQRVLAAEPRTLVVAGLPRTPVAGLAAILPTLLADDRLLRVGEPDGLSAAEAAALRRRVPELSEACRDLAASRIPDSLEHGDLSADQVIFSEEGPVFLDWSDGAITHPFLSAAFLLDEAERTGRPVDDLVAGYLGPWLGGGFGLDEAVGRDAIRLARIVRPLHLAALHADRVLPALVHAPEVARVVPDALRAILRA